jgi:hypothetical protein
MHIGRVTASLIGLCETQIVCENLADKKRKKACFDEQGLRVAKRKLGKEKEKEKGKGTGENSMRGQESRWETTHARNDAKPRRAVARRSPSCRSRIARRAVE